MRKINIEEWKQLCSVMGSKIDRTKYIGIYGVPRGGTLVALEISKFLLLPLLEFPEKDCVVVDDLIDSGKTKAKYPKHDFFALIDKRNLKINEWIEFWYEETQKDEEDLIVRILECIGENPKREGLIETPKRVVKLWREIFKGYNKENKPIMTSFDNGVDGILYDEMIFDTGSFFSTCEHHMVPFYGKYYFAYIPNKKIIGLSKVSRLIEYYSSKLQIQERLVKEIVDEVIKELEPLGVALILKAEHLCKSMRGTKNKGYMITSDLRGVFRDKPEARAELMSLIEK